MTPAVRAARAAGIDFELHEYEHDPAAASYGEEAARVLGLPPERVFKTLVAQLDGREFVVAVVPVSRQLDLKALAACCGAKRAALTEIAAAERLTGYVAGGISPLGQRRRSKTVIDASAFDFETVHVSAGRRGLEIELAPADLERLCQASSAPISR